jgi:hypothetical protein
VWTPRVECVLVSQISPVPRVLNLSTVRNPADRSAICVSSRVLQAFSWICGLYRKYPLSFLGDGLFSLKTISPVLLCRIVRHQSPQVQGGSDYLAVLCRSVPMDERPT